jgi:hypothetical protein
MGVLEELKENIWEIYFERLEENENKNKENKEEEEQDEKTI